MCFLLQDRLAPSEPQDGEWEVPCVCSAVCSIKDMLRAGVGIACPVIVLLSEMQTGPCNAARSPERPTRLVDSHAALNSQKRTGPVRSS